MLALLWPAQALVFTSSLINASLHIFGHVRRCVLSEAKKAAASPTRQQGQAMKPSMITQKKTGY